MESQKVQLTVPPGYAHAFLLFIGILLTGMIITAPIGIPVIIYALWINKQYRKQQEENYKREKQIQKVEHFCGEWNPVTEKFVK